MSVYATVFKTLKEYQGTVANTAIIGATAGIEAIVNVAVYRCPCVEYSQLSSTCNVYKNNSALPPCSSVQLNFIYGLSYLIGPAVLLFVFGIASNPKLWKLWTGCCNESEETKKGKRFSCWVLCGIFAKAIISPIAWVCFGLLGGQYYACAVTPMPYDLVSTNCIAIAGSRTTVQYGDEFKSNRGVSQVAGWISIGSIALIGFIAYSYIQCIFPLTYYHAKYYKIYRENEEAEFDDEMKIKAKADAERNIRRFMSKRRDKSIWDRIGTVFSFHRDKKNLALYSYLHEWVLEDEQRELLNVEMNENGNGGIVNPVVNPDSLAITEEAV